MNIFDGIEKLITEHGSAAILNQQLAFAKERFAELERKVSELQTQTGRLEGQLERERLDLQNSRMELKRLQDEHLEEIRINQAIEFRRGKRTGGVWLPFCPKCHMPAVEFGDQRGATCSVKCGWLTRLSGNLDSFTPVL